MLNNTNWINLLIWNCTLHGLLQFVQLDAMESIEYMIH